MDSLVSSLISGHLFSKGEDDSQGRFQRYIQEKGLSIILDEYNDVGAKSPQFYCLAHC